MKDPGRPVSIAPREQQGVHGAGAGEGEQWEMKPEAMASIE